MHLVPLLAAALALAAVATAAGAAEPRSADQLPAIKEFPDPFALADGRRVATPGEWREHRRSLAAALLDYEYGHLPPRPRNLKASQTSEESVLGGAAMQRKVTLTFGPRDAGILHVVATVPSGKPGPFPVLLTGDLCWGPAPIAEEAISRGYALVEFDRTEVAPDKAGRDKGVYPLYPRADGGALAMWAWAYHRAVDYLLTQPWVDGKRIAISGHSRGGKAVLLAGALDERIALTNPNDSGCGGAGSYRYHAEGSETLAAILRNFPFWFSQRLPAFVGQEDRLPFDQHSLLALVAPRGLLLTNALADAWANPPGSQQTYLAAREVYRFLGAESAIANHYREGGHAHNADDWRTLLDFADHRFSDRPLPAGYTGREFPGEPKAFSWTAPAASR